MKKMIVVLALLMFFLSSCSIFNYDEATRQIDVSAENMTSVDKIYDGYEELQGKDFGTFKMPEVIDVQRIEEVYSIVATRRDDNKSDEEKNKLFRAVFKDSFDESKCYHGENGFYSYENDNGDIANILEGVPQNAYTCEDDEIFSNVYEYEELGFYDVNRDKDVMLELIDGNCTVGELCESFEELIEAINEYYGNVNIKPLDVRYIKAGTSGNYATICCAVDIEGLIFEEVISPMHKVEKAGEYDLQTYYLFDFINIRVLGKDHISFVSFDSSPKDIEKTKTDKIISLNGAVNILKNELAPNSKYEFDGVGLRYCCKMTMPVYDATSEEAMKKSDKIFQEYMEEHEIPPYEPTWYFYWYNEERTIRQSIKVNAITGEITIDT